MIPKWVIKNIIKLKLRTSRVLIVKRKMAKRNFSKKYKNVAREAWYDLYNGYR